MERWVVSDRDQRGISVCGSVVVPVRVGRPGVPRNFIGTERNGNA